MAQQINHEEEYNKVIGTFDARISHLAQAQKSLATRSLNHVWDLSILLADVKEATPSTKVLGRLREERFPSIPSGDLSRYIYIGQNLAAVKQWYNSTNQTAISAQRIASGHKSMLAAEEKRLAAIKAYEMANGKEAQIAVGGGILEYEKRLKEGQKAVPTSDRARFVGRAVETFQQLYNAVDKLQELAKQSRLPDSVIKGLSDEISALTELLNHKSDQTAEVEVKAA